jgi:hypothetical protein
MCALVGTECERQHKGAHKSTILELIYLKITGAELGFVAAHSWDIMGAASAGRRRRGRVAARGERAGSRLNDHEGILLIVASSPAIRLASSDREVSALMSD